MTHTNAPEPCVRAPQFAPRPAARIGFFFLLCAVLACAEPGSEEEDSENGTSTLLASVSTGPVSDAALCCGTRTTLVEGIAGAENLFISSNERLFVSGDEGVYELVREGAGALQANKLVGPETCKFGGITETRGVLYVNCYGPSDSYLYATKVSGPASFRRIATLPGIALANGLSADEAGHLYVACTAQDQILRLTLAAADPLTIAKQEVWLSGSGLFTNGLKYYDSMLYWTDSISIKSARILSDGRPGLTRTLVLRLTFFDDLFVDAQGVLVADWLGSALRGYGPFGNEIGATTVALGMPSAVVRAKGRAGFSAKALLLTEKGANRVALFEPR